VNPNEPTRAHLLKQAPKRYGCPLFAITVASVVGLAIGLVTR
jgi:hypothetical protein